jgi:hypothetical protein
MFQKLHEATSQNKVDIEGATNIGQLVYQRKFNAPFAVEMNRSVKAILKVWTKG